MNGRLLRKSVTLFTIIQTGVFPNWSTWVITVSFFLVASVAKKKDDQSNNSVAQSVSLPFSFLARTCVWHSRLAAEGSAPGLPRLHVSSSHCSQDHPTCLYKMEDYSSG